jgi:protein-L-isoaspartate O-methyltransferase
MQTRKHGAIESVANVLVGYLVAVAARQLVRRFIGIEIVSDFCDVATDRLRQEELAV